MATFLFDKIIFGPVWSRRLGESLGINLLPVNKKVCNFNCVYCECGITRDYHHETPFPEVEEVMLLLESRLKEMQQKGDYLNSITFAGNGEPTLHPSFPEIIDQTILLRDLYYPESHVTVLSNATLIHSKETFKALLKVDLNILKLDSAIENTLQSINCPRGSFNLQKMLDSFELFNGKLIIQTLFLKGNFNGKIIDNTSEEELNALINVISKIKPEMMMIYSLARDTAVKQLESVPAEELNRIAERFEEAGIRTQVTP